MAYLSHAWGVGPTTFRRWKKERAAAAAAPEAEVKAVAEFSGNAIVNRDLAKERFTPKYLFAVYQRQLATSNENFTTGRVSSQELLNEAMKLWDTMAGDPTFAQTCEYWNKRARDHDAAQPDILDQILKMLKKNPSLSFPSVAGKLTSWTANATPWCSGETIRRLFEACGYCEYLERALPLMTKAQRKEAVKFGRQLRNNWGQGKGKYLVINIDEKYFAGLRTAHAKKCERLGLEKSHLYCQHGSHISQVMVLAATAYAFTDHFENGGTGYKLGLFRCEAAKTAQMDVFETVKDPESGKITRPNAKKGGKLKRARGTQYMVDCTMRGSDSGTSTDPKFNLLRLFKHHLFPAVQKLVARGGRFAGHTVVWQWDNAPPHVDKTLVSYLTSFCAAQRKPWLWRSQPAQLPISNTCDLYVFPLMARRHAHLVREQSPKAPASANVIWEVVERVWKAIPSADIASSHVLAYRVMGQLVASNGGTNFLHDEGIHSGLRRDFVHTSTGIKRRDGAVLAAP